MGPKNIYTVYAMEQTGNNEESGEVIARIKQRFWCDENIVLADLGNILEYLGGDKPPFKWLAENCEEKNGRLYISGKKALELILDLAATGVIKAETTKLIWYGQYISGHMIYSAMKAYQAEVMRQSMETTACEDEVISECEDGDGG